MAEPPIDDGLTGEVILSPGQRRFVRWTAAVLTDIVVLNLYVEYVHGIVIDSFTISVGAAILIRILLQLTLGAEHRIAAYFGQRSGPGTRLGRVLGAWLVLFLSKFVILEAIDIVFSDRVDLGGLAWVIALSVTLVAVERATLAVFRRL